MNVLKILLTLCILTNVVVAETKIIASTMSREHKNENTGSFRLILIPNQGYMYTIVQRPELPLNHTIEE